MILIFCTKNKFVSKKSVEFFTSDDTNIVEFGSCGNIFFSIRFIGTEHLKVIEYVLNRYCSCEKVLWAIGAFVIVNLYCLIGFIKNLGNIKDFLFWNWVVNEFFSKKNHESNI